MRRVAIIGQQRDGAVTLLIRRQRGTEASAHSGVRVAVRCPSCGRIAESQTRGTIFLPEPLLGSALELHAACDLRQLFAELSAAALDFALAIHNGRPA